MAISQNFPNTRPSLNLNFARSKKLDSRITFTRSSTATYVDEDGLIKSVATNTPRFDHDPVTGDCLGLLIEESRTNLLTYSDYSSGNSVNNVTLTTNATTAPDGTNTAISMTGNAGTSLKYLYKLYTTTTTGTYTTSVFAKYNGEQYILLRVNDNTGVNDGQQRFDILNGIKNGNVANGGTATGASSTITPYPNGWYRLTVTCTFNSALTSIQGASVFLTGYTTTSSTSSVYLWAPQLETGAFPTSYIPTVASTVTRSADNASMTGTNFSSWYNSSEGNVTCSGRFLYTNSPTVGQGLWGIGDSSTFNESMYLVNDGGQTNITFNMIDGGVNQAQFSSSSVTSGSFNKISISYKANDSAGSFNSSTPTTDTSCTLPTVNVLKIGNISWGTFNPLNGTISQLSYYPVRLSNSQLQNLTK